MIAIIDYDVGNLRSVEKALQFLGYDTSVTSDKNAVLNADGVVLPGVGAFADAMRSLKKAGMVDILREIIKNGIPFLGICLGLQLLFDYSHEGGQKVNGLGILRGEIKKIPSGTGLKVPHMGWNFLKIKDESPVFNEVRNKPYVYFVHSYYLSAENRSIVKAVTEYGIKIDAAVEKENVFATQFHPEKSGKTGLTMLENWAASTGAKKNREFLL